MQKRKFSSNLNMKGSDLTKTLEPVYNSLTGDGDFLYQYGKCKWLLRTFEEITWVML